MSRLRNRNIRTKIQAITKWGHNAAAKSQTNGKLFENGGTTTTADSGIEELVPLQPKQTNLTRTRPSKDNWNVHSNHSNVLLDEFDAQHQENKKSNRIIEDSSEDESRLSSSSVDTLRVLNEIHNLEDSVMSMSADSYNSWNAEYESTDTQLVKAEFERMERVLQCQEPIPVHYDKEEYKLWIKTFPLWSLVSRTQSSDYRKPSPSFDRIDQISTPILTNISPLTPTQHNLSDKSANEILDHFEALNLTTKKQIPSSTTTYSNKYLAINNTLNPRIISINADHSFLQLAPLNISSIQRRQSFKPSNNNILGSKSTSGKTTIASSGKSNSSSTTRSSAYISRRTSDWSRGTQEFNDLRLTNATRQQMQLPNHLRVNNFSTNQCDRYEKHPRKKSSKTEPLKSSSDFIVLPPIEGKELRSSSAATICSLGKTPSLPLSRLKHPPVQPLYENDSESQHTDGFVSFRHRKRKYK